jgi:uncharacterized glyoxalase superfamily protein PhnB
MTETAPPNIFPTVRYRDADAALAWLTQAFGFTEHAVHRNDAGVVEHGELQFGRGMIMFGQHRDDGLMPTDCDPTASAVGLYVVVDDPDTHHDRAVAAGAEIVRELADKPWGSRDYGVRDLDGHLWWFGTYSPYAVAGPAASA